MAAQPGSDNVRMNISVKDGAAVHDVANRLRAAGIGVEQELDGLGVLTVVAGSQELAQIASVEGVADVEPEQAVQLPPPDSDVQ